MRSGVVSIDDGELFGRRLALELLQQLALDAVQLVDRLDHVHGHADRARLVGDAARDRLADPPRRVGRELVAAAPVVLLDGAHEADVAFLDEVEEEHAAADVAFRDRHHETQVGLDQLAARGRVVALDALRERDLLGGREQRDAADLAQVGAHRIVRPVAHVDVDRRAGPSTSGSSSSSSSSTAMTSKPCASRAGASSSSPCVREQAEQLRAGELVLVVGIVACQGVRHQLPLVRGAYAPPALRASAWSSCSSLISSGVISAAASFSLSGSSRRSIQRDSTRPATSPRASGPPCRAASARNSASRRCTSSTDGTSILVQPRAHPGVRSAQVRHA